MTRALVVAAGLALLTGTAARAQPAHTTLRMATIAPDGTLWARELRAFSREVADATSGSVQVKWYFGGIAGDDVQVQERIRRDQLDGAASGGMLCERVSSTFRALRVPGLYRSRDEVRYVAGQLKPQIEKEFLEAGYFYVGHALLGPQIIASRTPVRSLADLKRTRLWAWDFDDMTNQPLREAGLQLVTMPVERAAAAYAEGKADGFITVPTALLAFQWSAQARYVSDLSPNFLVSCMVITNRVADRLTLAERQAVSAAVAKLSGRLEAVGDEQDKKLLHGAFSRQGLQPLTASEAFREEFLHVVRTAAERLGPKLIAPALLAHVSDLLARRRAEH